MGSSCVGSSRQPGWVFSRPQRIVRCCQLRPHLCASSKSSMQFIPFMQLPLIQIKSIPQESGRSPSPRLSNAWAPTHHIFYFIFPCFMMTYLRAIV